MTAKVVIVGSGIVGSLIAYRLTKAGIAVRIFEKGPEYPYPYGQQFTEERLNFWQNPAWTLPADLRNLGQSGDYGQRVNDERIMHVGGSASRWGGMTGRLHPHDFRTKSLYGRGEDWPITYEDLEPYYCEAESLLGVSGDDAGNPFAAPRSKPYPLPEFSLSYDVALIAERVKQKGLYLNTSPQARTRQAYDGRPACENFGACVTCPIGARYSPAHHLARAMSTGLCTLETNVSVRRILVDERGRATGVLYRANDRSSDVEAPASYVVVAGGAIESARLLLLSADDKNPNGLGNRSGHVGQHLMFHHIWIAHAHYKEDLFAGRVGPAMGTSRQFIDVQTRDRHGGVQVQFTSDGEVPVYFHRGADRPGMTAKAILDSMRSMPQCEIVHLHAESPPSAKKFVKLSAANDRFGDPFGHVHYEISPFDHDTFAYAQKILNRFVEGSDGQVISTGNGPTSFVNGHHHMGTCRMGKTLADSVVDKNGQIHDAPGVFVIGGANFPSSTAVHPTLTMAALAVRAADHLERSIPR